MTWNTSMLRSALLCLLPATAVFTFSAPAPVAPQDHDAQDAEESRKEEAIEVHYLEIVTPEVDEMCGSLEKMHGVKFSKPVAEFGGARTASLEGGGLLGVRAPMREDEAPVVRPYLLVDDIDAAVEAAKEAGAQVAMPPMAIPKRGKFAIYIQGGIQHGLWQM